jgi:hypothetical protein
MLLGHISRFISDTKPSDALILIIIMYQLELTLESYKMDPVSILFSGNFNSDPIYIQKVCFLSVV